jgi:hypothetical protein
MAEAKLWGPVMSLLDGLMESADPEGELATEPDPKVRAAAATCGTIIC